ncbi:hypothetical protein I4U23_017237 [Adineta vaga]|nr:hypothetical protein I4U23_017237 [Adineta vaga]
MSSLSSSLVFAQQTIIRYGFPVSLTLGNIGNFFIIVVFCRKKHRRNPCSLYLLAAAVFSIIGINWGIGSNMYALYQPPDPFIQSLFLCRFRGYILQTSSLLYKCMILLGCVDRFALTSPRAGIRAFSKPKFALKMIGGFILFGLLISIHLPINQTILNNRCLPSGTYGFFFSIYQVCIFGVILPISQIFFSFLIVKNLKLVRVRIQPMPATDSIPQNILTRHDITLIKLILTEIILGILLTTLYPISLLYSILTSNLLNKSTDRIAIESFMSFLALIILFYLNYCITFYIYLAISKPFRQEIKQMILKIIKWLEPEQIDTVAHSINVRRRVEHI